VTLTVPDLGTDLTVDEQVPCEAQHEVDGVLIPCPEVATWDLILQCPDGATKTRHACDWHTEGARGNGGYCSEAGHTHRVVLIAAYPRRTR
jgi:hypothetical protein